MSQPSYFGTVRTDIAPLLRGSPRRILEIGTGAGVTLAWLKQRWPDAETIGVDGYAPAVAELEKNADRALLHDLEQPLPDLGRFDLILALDVLEHLREPVQVLRGLRERLNPDGAIIVSVPNVSHHKVIRGLIGRKFEYADSGILDRTHLRFFTEQSTIELMRDAGLKITDGLLNGLAGPKPKLINRATLGLIKHYLTDQYIVRGIVSDAPQPAFRWGIAP
jgi:2-polyprenyl-3-methyl-5-hydroxy-6-metoxy-1,4-benzoquinol methylase